MGKLIRKKKSELKLHLLRKQKPIKGGMWTVPKTERCTMQMTSNRTQKENELQMEKRG